MPDDDKLPVSPLVGADALLARYRERIMYWFAVIVVVAVTPFALNNIAHGRIALGSAIIAVILSLATDAVAIHFKKSPPIPFPLLLLPLMASVGTSLVTQGLYGVLWCYPAILFCYFVLSWRMAIFWSVAMLGLFSPMVYYYVGPDVAVRFIVSLGITIAGINIIINLIHDLQNRLLDQIITDPLTGAFNRRQMNVVLAEAIERNKRTGAVSSILVLDIDHFKRVNDDFGHLRGDQVLKGLVAIISEKSRKLDRLFRMGGEEFLLFLSDTRASDAVVRAENLRQEVASAPLLKRPVTISVGVSEIANDTAIESWIERADEALYAAKQGGRNRVVCAVDKKSQDSSASQTGKTDTPQTAV